MMATLPVSLIELFLSTVCPKVHLSRGQSNLGCLRVHLKRASTVFEKSKFSRGITMKKALDTSQTVAGSHEDFKGFTAGSLQP